MKKIIFSLLLTFCFLNASAQKGTHKLSAQFFTTETHWDWYTIVWPHIKSHDMLGLRYKYGVSDVFSVSSDFDYKIDNEADIDYHVGANLHTNVYTSSYTVDGEKTDVAFYAITGITHTGTKGQEFGKSLGGNFGIGYELIGDDHFYGYREIGYNTKEKWFFTFGIGYKF